MANILHDSLRESSFWPHFLLRGDPITYSKQRYSFVFNWRGLKHLVPLKEMLAPKEDPVAYLQTIMAALIRKGGLDQPPGRRIRFRSRKQEEQAVRQIRFPVSQKMGVK